MQMCDSYMPDGRLHRLMTLLLCYCLRTASELPPICCCWARTQPTTCSRKNVNLPLGLVRKCGSPAWICRCLTVQAEQPRSCATSRIVIGSPKLLPFMLIYALSHSLAQLCAGDLAIKFKRNKRFPIRRETDYLPSCKHHRIGPHTTSFPRCLAG